MATVGEKKKHQLPFSRGSFAIAHPTPKYVDTNPEKNGGPIAWLHCLAAFLLFFNGWGMINSFGKYDIRFRLMKLIANERP